MPVEFTPVKIKIFKPPQEINKLLRGVDPITYGQFETDPQTIIFLCKRSAKTVMRRLHKKYPLKRGEQDHAFIVSHSVLKEKKIPKIKRAHLTKFKRSLLPRYIHVSLDGKVGYRVITRENRVYFNGRLVRLSGKKFKNTNFYSLEE